MQQPPRQPPQQPWGYRPPQPEKPPGAPPPWYRHPVGMLLIGAVVVIVLALILPTFTAGGGDPDPVPTVTSGAFGPPGTPPPAAGPTTSAGPATAADQLGQAVQGELGEVGTVSDVQAPPGGRITVTWDITPAGSEGLTRNNARFGVMRIMRAIQQTSATAGGGEEVRLVGRYQLPGASAPATVVRLRFEPSTVQRADFDDRRYLEAFQLADAAAIHPAFRD